MEENEMLMPKRRFKEFQDTKGWEQRKLGKVKDVRDGTHDSPKYFQTGYPLVTSKNLTDSGLDMSDVSLISEDDFERINKRSKIDIGDIIFGMIGTIGTPVIIDRCDFAIKNVALIKDSGDVQNPFLLQLLKSPMFERYIQNENAGNTQKFLGLNKIREYNFFTPNSDEQTAIGNFFRILDDTITLQQRKLEKTKALKSAYLSEMFPTEGECVPKRRFAGFTDAWEQRKLGELSDIVRGSSPRPIQDPKWFDKNSDVGWLRISDVTEQNGRIFYLEQKISKAGQEKTRVLTEPHLLLSIAATVGKPVINYIKTGVHDGFLIFLNPKFEQEFMFQWLEMFRVQWQNYGQPGSQINLNSDLVKNQEILIPTIKEQIAIGNFFRILDNFITHHQRKLDKLQDIKKAYLHEMFI